MTTQNQTVQTPAKVSSTNLTSILFVALLGAGMIGMVGMAQSQTLHDAAHDLRHATGFACH